MTGAKDMVETTMNANIRLPIYLDYQATTPLDPRVLEAMMPYYTDKFGNAHSRSHAFGWEAEEGVETARAQVASIIGADPREIIFTSGATESNNLALKGVARFYKERKDHIVTVVTEHKCVLDTCRHLEEEGFAVTYVPVGDNGLVDLDVLRDALTERTVLVSVMGVNNEIGVIQPLAEIGALCRENGVFFHSDAAQAVGKMPIDVNAMKIDLLSISGHKIYGPMGIGALFVRSPPAGAPEGDDRRRRPGARHALGHPADAALRRPGPGLRHRREGNGQRGRTPSHACGTAVWTAIMERLPRSTSTATPNSASRATSIISFAYVEGEGLMMGIKDLAVSSGSACTSASLEPSYVLRALGVDEELAHTSIRFGIGRFTTEAESGLRHPVRRREHVERLARDEPAMGDGPGRHRHQIDRMGRSLIAEPLDNKAPETEEPPMAYSEKVIDHYENPRNVGSIDKDAKRRGHRSRRCAGLRRRHEDADQGRRQRHHRGRQVQDLRLRFRDCLLEPRHRMDQGQDDRRGGNDQEYPHRPASGAAAREDSLLGTGRGRDQGGDRRLPYQERLGIGGPAGVGEVRPAWGR